ncbi:uncharacterized protein BROUX77_006343 [Berkeleyomyces rouxiae]|uniref:uncharacterized protein n=1 Tax=Berkeleyomyces rouxiae TaxID=2035830 RepID=UPI003B77A47A
MGKISAETEALLSRAMAFKEKNPKISIAQAARQFGVQKDLLRRRLIGVRPAKGKKPAYRLFSDGEEAALVDYINRYYGSNYPLSKEAIVSFANGILRARCHSVDQDPLVVGKNWVTRFLARKEYTVLHQKTLDARKRKAENADVVNAWFLRLEETISKYGIVDADIWNVNEMVFQLHVEDGQMVATTEPKLAKRTTFETRDTATLIESASAAGETCPLYVVFKGAEHLANWRDVSDVRPPMQVSVSSTRWNTDRIQLDWIDLFHRQTEKYRIGKHCLLLLDGFGSHHTKEFMDKCEEYREFLLVMLITTSCYIKD